ncbi:MAG: calcium/sodium antiporter [Treponema sp.]|nr:calcium/sodium antiporter [Treponema sp.]
MSELLSGIPLEPYILLALGLVVLVACGNWLVTGSVQLARHFRVSTFIVGLTIVAYGTSAPEMFISIGAALDGSHDIALGNIIGSNIANIGAILAIVAIVATIPIRNRALGFDLAAMFAVTVLLFVFGLNGVIGFFEGLGLVAVLAAYTSWSVVKSRKTAVAGEAAPATVRPLAAAALVLVALVGLYFGAGWFVDGAREIATRWGVSERVIAISVVAIGTSTPELVASLVAAIKKEADLSIGNIIGSNLFNIAGVLGVTAMVRPLAVADRAMFVSDMIWLFGISVILLLTMLPLAKGKISRWEGGILLAIFSAYMFMLFA